MKRIRNLLLAFVCAGLFLYPGSTRAQDTLSLDRAYRLALENNERLQISRQQLDVAKQDVREAFGRLLPELSVNAQSYRQKEVRQFGAFSAPTEETNFSADLRQPIYQGGKNIAGLNVRQYQRAVAELRLFRRKQEILFNVAKIYFNALLSGRNVRIQRNALERARTQLERARARYDVGKVTNNAVLRSKVEVSDAKEKLEQARNDVKLAREDLAVELGVSTIPDSFQSVEYRPLSDTPIETFKKRAYENRRDLAEKTHQLDAAQARVEFERSDYYPSVNLVGRYDRYEDEQFHGTESDWRVTLQGSYPIFSGFQEDAQLKRAKLQHRSVREEYRRLKREIRRNVRRVHLDLQSQRTVIRTLESRVKSARENYREISAQFEEGLVDSVDVSDALTILREAELRMASARNSLMLDRLRLKLATGTYLESLLTKGKQQ